MSDQQIASVTAMWPHAVALIVIFGVAPSLGLLAWNDPCLISPNRLPQIGEVIKIDFTRECPNVEVRWDYPQGTLQIDFLPPNKAEFQLCLKSGFANFIREIYSVVDGKRISMKPPTEGNDSCAPSTDGEFQLVLVAPPTQYYMTSVEFYTTLS